VTEGRGQSPVNRLTTLLSYQKENEMEKLLLTLVLVLAMVTASFGAEINLCQNNKTNGLRFAPGNDPTRCYRSETAIKLQDGAPGPTGVIDVLGLASQIQTEIPYDPTKFVFAGAPATITTSATEKIISSPGYVTATIGWTWNGMDEVHIFFTAGIGYRPSGTNDDPILVTGSGFTYYYYTGLPTQNTFDILLPPFSPGAGIWDIGVVVKNHEDPVGYSRETESSLNRNGFVTGWLMIY
jgi:hypothetical protein